MLIKQLHELGLAEKEAKVYLAALELGPCTVQQISRKCGVNRPSTYVQVEFLTKKGLMSNVIKGKKRYFNAESPEQLVRILEKRMQEIDLKKAEFEKYLPELKALNNISGEKPSVKFFEGEEGIKSIRQDILRTKTDSIREFLPINNIVPKESEHRKQMSEQLQSVDSIKIIYSSTGGFLLPAKENNRERRVVPAEKFPFKVEIIVYGNKVALISTKNKLVGVIIENDDVAKGIISIFDLAWEAAEKYKNE